ncbi:Ankyrin repeat-containing domain,Ankyrin repeat [Cinara cedri]|uniref:Ankyrin repeat-containing domain,Ankyrin repeat n=1 Tax=Cinara cedri TaxID=506608 RepID=A0A5E4NNF0_9HEMI|nr:Ankyrin repeat-containing domain,Ankyrin repeat [Cinara cedri]
MFTRNKIRGGRGTDTTPLINDLPEVEKKRDLIRKCLERAIDITTKDEESNNVLHIIASMPKKEKIIWLAKIPKNQLAKAINAENKNGQTPMQIAFHAKINKKSHYHRTISTNDSTLKFIVALLNNGAKVDQLQLSEEYLAALSNSQKNYHINFLKKLASKYKITQVNTNITKCDSGFESGPDDTDSMPSTHEIKTTEPILTENKSKNPYATIQETKEGFDSSLKTIKGKNLANFKKYLEKISVTTTDTEGNNILHLIASMLRKKKITRLNLILKSEISKDQLEKAINAENKNGLTPMQVAINAENKNGLTPMQVALSAKINKESHHHNTIPDSDNTLEFIIKLLKNGADPSQLQLSEALSQSTRNYYYDFLKKLAQSSKDKAIPSKDKIIHTIDHIIYGRYPLHLAVLRQDQNMFSALLLKNYSITKMDAEGNNILHLIASMPNKTKITWLNLIPKNGTFNDQLTEAINATNKNGRTPIQAAIVNKITKDTHRTFTISDNTVNFCIKLLNHPVLNNEAKSEDCRRHFVLPGKYSSDRYIKFLQKLIKDERINADHTKDILGDILKEQIAQHQENKKLNKGIKNTRNNCWTKTKKCGKVILDFINPNKTVDRMTKLAIAALTVVAAFFTFVIIAFAAINGQLPIAAAVPIMLAFVVTPIVIKYFQSNNELEKTDNSAKNEKPNSRMTDILTGTFKNGVRVLN